MLITGMGHLEKRFADSMIRMVIMAERIKLITKNINSINTGFVAEDKKVETAMSTT